MTHDITAVATLRVALADAPPDMRIVLVREDGTAWPCVEVKVREVERIEFA